MGKNEGSEVLGFWSGLFSSCRSRHLAPRKVFPDKGEAVLIGDDCRKPYSLENYTRGQKTEIIGDILGRRPTCTDVFDKITKETRVDDRWFPFTLTNTEDWDHSRQCDYACRFDGTVVVLVFAVDEPASFDNIVKLHEEIQSSRPDLHFVLVATRKYLRDDKDTIENGSGLYNMKSRAKLIDTGFSLTSEKDEGVSLILTYPLNPTS